MSGTFIFAISQWVIVALIAKLSGPVALGRFTLAGAIVAPVLAFTQIQLRAVLATDARFEYRFRDFVQVRGWLTLIMLVATPTIAFLVGTESVTLGVITGFVAAKALDSIADVLYGYHQRREEFRVIAIGQYLNGGLSVVLFGGLLYLTEDLIIATGGYAVASGLVLVGWAVPITIVRRRRDTIDPRDQHRAPLRLLRLALPLGVVMVIAGVATNLPRYAVQISMGEAALGIFGGLAYMVLVGTNFISALGQAASPRLAKHAASGGTGQFMRVLRFLVGISVGTAALGVLVALVWGSEIVTLIYSPEFARHSDVLVALACAALVTFPAIVLAVAATAARSFRAQLPVFGIVLVVGTAACAALVPVWGLMGAAVATALMGVAQAIGCAVLVRSALWRASA